MPSDSQPMIAIVGRPNVGKSALFNCIVGRRISIVHEQSGVTRDNIVSRARYRGHVFMLVDTGGLGVFEDEKRVDRFDDLVRTNVSRVIDEADRLIWVVDTQTGPTPLDHEIAGRLRKSGRPVVVAANKADNSSQRLAALSLFGKLAPTGVVPISCLHRKGIAELLDTCVRGLSNSPKADEEEAVLRLAVVGRPNVGKSSLVNRFLGQERVIVSDAPGTTRDAVDVPCHLTHGDQSLPITLIDTAGLRKRRRLDSAVEVFSVMRAENAIRRSDVVVLLLDATAVATAQDRRIAHMIQDAGKPCITAANKWDLVAADGVSRRELGSAIRRELPFMGYAPIVCLSALTGQGMGKLLDRLVNLYERMQVVIPTPVVNDFIADLMARTPPPEKNGRIFKVLYATMIDSAPPRLALFVNHRDLCPAHYLQYLSNRVRETFFADSGLPVLIDLRTRRGQDRIKDRSRPGAAGAAKKRRLELTARARRRNRFKRRHR